MALADFKYYYRGREVSDHAPLETKSIRELGIQTFGGVYSDFKQSGASVLEIDWIKLL